MKALSDQLALIYNADSLALGARYRLGLHQLYLRADTEYAVDIGGYLLLQLLDGLDCIREHIGGYLYKYLEGVCGTYAVYDYLIVGGSVGHLEKNGLYLRREYVYALDYEHIVCSAHRLRHLDKRSAAGALLAREHANVAGAVSQQRESLLVEAGEYQLAL